MVSTKKKVVKLEPLMDPCMNCVDPGQMASADLHLKRFIGFCKKYPHSAFIRPNTVFVQLVQQRKGEKPDLV